VGPRLGDGSRIMEAIAGLVLTVIAALQFAT
jgi:hypothetical protein